MTCQLTKEEFVHLRDEDYAELMVVYVQEVKHPDMLWAAVLDTLPDGRAVAVYGLDPLYFAEDTYGTEWVAFRKFAEKNT